MEYNGGPLLRRFWPGHIRQPFPSVGGNVIPIKLIPRIGRPPSVGIIVFIITAEEINVTVAIGDIRPAGLGHRRVRDQRPCVTAGVVTPKIIVRTAVIAADNRINIIVIVSERSTCPDLFPRWQRHVGRGGIAPRVGSRVIPPEGVGAAAAHAIDVISHHGKIATCVHVTRRIGKDFP